MSLMLLFTFSRWIGLFACLAILAHAQPPAASQPNQTPTGGLSGVAFDAQTNAPLRRAIITLSTVESRPQDAVAWTDGNGRFGFSYLPSGRYQLRAQKDGYRVFVYLAKDAAGPPDTFELAAGEVGANIDLRLQRLGTISGVVLTDGGQPLPFAR